MCVVGRQVVRVGGAGLLLTVTASTTLLAKYRGARNVSAGVTVDSNLGTCGTTALDSTSTGTVTGRNYTRVSDNGRITDGSDGCNGHLTGVTGTLNGGVGNAPIGCGICVADSIGT